MNILYSPEMKELSKPTDASLEQRNMPKQGNSSLLQIITPKLLNLKLKQV